MSNSVKMTISLPRSLAEFTRQTAASRKMSRSRFIAELLDAEARRSLDESLADGYRNLAIEAQTFADEALALADEVWEGPARGS